MTTADIIITILGVALAAGVGNIIYNLRINNRERQIDRERLIRIETRLEGLDSMRDDIERNRHKLTDLDKGMTDLNGRVTVLEKTIDNVKAFCNRNHTGNL